MLQLLQGGAEILEQFCSCKVLTYHKIISINLLLTMLTTTWGHYIAYTFHGLGVIAYVILGRSTVMRSLCRAIKMDELQAVGHNYICNSLTFSVGLDHQRHYILHAQFYADTRATIDLLWKMSLLFRSPHHPWSAQMQATHRGSHPGQRSVHLMLVVDTDHWKMSGIVSTLIFVILPSATVLCPSLLWPTFMADGHDNHQE